MHTCIYCTKINYAVNIYIYNIYVYICQNSKLKAKIVPKSVNLHTIITYLASARKPESIKIRLDSQISVNYLEFLHS